MSLGKTNTKKARRKRTSHDPDRTEHRAGHGAGVDNLRMHGLWSARLRGQITGRTIVNRAYDVIERHI